MVKRTILAALFFVLTAGIFGALSSEAHAQAGVSCTTTQGWVGTCTLKSACNESSSKVAWDNTVDVCKKPGSTGSSQYGCCGTTNRVCDFAGDKKAECEKCMGADNTGAWTALGCVKTDPQQFISEILRIAIGIGGGIAFLLILFGGFQVLTSAGNPEHLNAGKELVTSAIIGLLLIIFSLFLLRLIGYNIFGLPGFG